MEMDEIMEIRVQQRCQPLKQIDEGPEESRKNLEKLAYSAVSGSFDSKARGWRRFSSSSLKPMFSCRPFNKNPNAENNVSTVCLKYIKRPPVLRLANTSCILRTNKEIRHTCIKMEGDNMTVLTKMLLERSRQKDPGANKRNRMQNREQDLWYLSKLEQNSLASRLRKVKSVNGFQRCKHLINLSSNNREAQDALKKFCRYIKNEAPSFCNLCVKKSSYSATLYHYQVDCSEILEWIKRNLSDCKISTPGKNKVKLLFYH